MSQNNHRTSLSKNDMKSIRGGLTTYILWGCSIGGGGTIVICGASTVNPQSYCGNVDGQCDAGVPCSAPTGCTGGGGGA